MFRANEIVRQRQAKIVHALEQLCVQFALSGSNATFVWIASVDEAAARQYRNVEFIIQRQDLEKVTEALAELGLNAVMRPDHLQFRNDHIRRDRWSDRALFADHVLESNTATVPNLNSTEMVGGLRVISLETLVIFQLSRWSLDDRVDLRDMIDVGLLNREWLDQLKPDLAPRMQKLLDYPDG